MIEEDLIEREAEIERKRNKSRLNPQHRNILNNKKPYEEPKIWLHGTVKYQRHLYGKYGSSSGINPELCWPTKKELQDKLEYERVAFPYTITQAVEEAQKKRAERNQKIMQRQEEIVKKMAKLETWTKDLMNRIAKKEAEAKAVKDRKDKLVEEVRRYFGYTVDPRDEKFKEMLEKKEKEQKKAMREAKRKAKEEKLIAKLTQENNNVGKEKSKNT